MSLLHGIKYIDTAGVAHGFIDNAGAPQICSQDYLMAVAEGDIAGHTPFAKFGRVTAVGTNQVDVISWGGTYTFSSITTGERISVASTASGDSATQTGAIKINIDYLDNTFTQGTEELTLAGNTTVTTTAINIYRINRAYVTSAGTTGAAAGAIRISNANGSNRYAQIDSGNTMTRQLVYTVPLGKSLYITSVKFSGGVGGNAIKNEYLIFTTKAKVNPGTGLASTIFYPYNEIGLMNMAHELPLEIPTKIPATADLKISVIGDYAGDATCTAAIRGWIE